MSYDVTLNFDSSAGIDDIYRIIKELMNTTCYINSWEISEEY